MKENELQELIKELQLTIENYRKKNIELTKKEKRIQIASGTLEKQAQEMEALRTELISPQGPLARIREEKAELDKTRILIATTEQDNIKKLAKQYDKMDSASGSQMLAEMCNKREDDAVKILYYMSPRKSAQMLSEMSNQTLSAKLCGRLIKIQEQKTQE